MECPNCGNEVYERLDYAIVRCTQCMSLWDPFVYPGFPEPSVDIGEIWDTTQGPDEDAATGEVDLDEDLGELEEEEGYDWDIDAIDEEEFYEDDFEDWDDEEDDYDDDDDD